jgi:hypothetical protein
MEGVRVCCFIDCPTFWIYFLIINPVGQAWHDYYTGNNVYFLITSLQK